jgi:ABC-type sugar transport system ATPase subunit
VGPIAGLTGAGRRFADELERRHSTVVGAVILISHNLPQVMALADRVMVLRAGAGVGTLETRSTDMEQIVRLITGAEALSA